MRLIKRKKLDEAAKECPLEIQKAIESWYTVLKQAKWQNLDDIRKNFNRSVDKVGNFYVFNIKSYRLIVGIDFPTGKVYFKYLLSHEEYEEGKWKDDPYF